jgi:hypothetical protein
MKARILFLTSALLISGCTSLSLQRETIAQSQSVTSLRYQEVVNNLALIANDATALPSYSSIFAGTTQITDTWQFGSTTTWLTKGIMGSAVSGFSSETISPQFSRNVTDNWSLDPVLAPEKLEAMRSACWWALFGKEKACEGPYFDLLASPNQSPTPGRHFGVLDQLTGLPTGWLHVGKLTDVAANACYKARSDRTWVWVTPDGLPGLSDLTLVLQNIARVSINSPSLFYWPPPPCIYDRITSPKPLPAGNMKDQNVDQRKLEVYAYTDGCNHLLPAVPYQQYRFENLGTDSSFRSYISAAGAK